jgi:hypothetical protein
MIAGGEVDQPMVAEADEPGLAEALVTDHVRRETLRHRLPGWRIHGRDLIFVGLPGPWRMVRYTAAQSMAVVAALAAVARSLPAAVVQHYGAPPTAGLPLADSEDQTESIVDGDCVGATQSVRRVHSDRWADDLVAVPAAAGGVGCPHWWGTPTWPRLVTRFLHICSIIQIKSPGDTTAAYSANFAPGCHPSLPRSSTATSLTTFCENDPGTSTPTLRHG